MAIFKKLHEIQKATRSLLPDAKGQTGQAFYNYVSGSKVLGRIRPIMDDLGVILDISIEGIENTPITYHTRNGEKTEMFTTIHCKFTWIDCEDGSTHTSHMSANGMNAWDKGLGSALTYAERYYLLKFFHIATDKDDVDAIIRDDFDSTPNQAIPQAQVSAPAPQVNEIDKAIAEAFSAKSKDELTAIWNKWSQFKQDIGFINAIKANPNHPNNNKK